MNNEYAKWRAVLDCLYPCAFPLTPTTVRCLQGEVCQTAEAAFDSWVRIVARYYDAENAIRQFRKERKS